MVARLLLVISFVFGILFQAFILLKGKKIDFGPLKILIIFTLFISLMAFFPQKNEKEYNIYVHFLSAVMVFVLFFSLMFSIIYRKEILPVINEQTILVFTIAFLFILLKYAPLLLFFCTPLLFVVALASIGTLILVLTKIQLSSNFRVLFYAWFMLAAFATLVLQLSFGLLSLSGLSEKISVATSIDVFFIGALFLCASGYTFYLFDLLPIPGKRQTLDNRIREWKGYLALLSSKYSDSQIKPLYAILIILVEGGSFLLNAMFHFVPDFLLINLFIIIAPQLPLSVLTEEKSNQDIRNQDSEPATGNP